jgi:hypothetical protein
MILLTVPSTVVLGSAGIREVSRFSSAILADLVMRGFAISFTTLARVALADSLLRIIQHASIPVKIRRRMAVALTSENSPR